MSYPFRRANSSARSADHVRLVGEGHAHGRADVATEALRVRIVREVDEPLRGPALDQGRELRPVLGIRPFADFEVSAPRDGDLARHEPAFRIRCGDESAGATGRPAALVVEVGVHPQFARAADDLRERVEVGVCKVARLHLGRKPVAKPFGERVDADVLQPMRVHVLQLQAEHVRVQPSVPHPEVGGREYRLGIREGSGRGAQRHEADDLLHDALTSASSAGRR